MVNQVCGSGLRSIASGFHSILSNNSNVVVAGGQESMSQAPHVIHLRNGKKLGDTELIDSMIKDGLSLISVDITGAPTKFFTPLTNAVFFLTLIFAPNRFNSGT